jgi:hypothetical protein
MNGTAQLLWWEKYVRGIWLVSPFFGKDVLHAPVPSSSACEALHGDSAGCPYHAFSLAIPVEFNAFLTLSMPSSIGGVRTLLRNLWGILRVMRNQWVDQLGPKLSPFEQGRKGNWMASWKGGRDSAGGEATSSRMSALASMCHSTTDLLASHIPCQTRGRHTSAAAN